MAAILTIEKLPRAHFTIDRAFDPRITPDSDRAAMKKRYSWSLVARGVQSR